MEKTTEDLLLKVIKQAIIDHTLAGSTTLSSTNTPTNNSTTVTPTSTTVPTVSSGSILTSTNIFIPAATTELTSTINKSGDVLDSSHAMNTSATVPESTTGEIPTSNNTVTSSLEPVNTVVLSTSSVNVKLKQFYKNPIINQIFNPTNSNESSLAKGRSKFVSPEMTTKMVDENWKNLLHRFNPLITAEFNNKTGNVTKSVSSTVKSTVSKEEAQTTVKVGENVLLSHLQKLRKMGGFNRPTGVSKRKKRLVGDKCVRKRKWGFQILLAR